MLVAQAWHWFDPVSASTEAARVLRPGGTLGLLWNVREVTPGWTAALAEILEQSKEIMDQENPVVDPELFRANGATVVA